jgi:hypothetical protein
MKFSDVPFMAETSDLRKFHSPITLPYLINSKSIGDRFARKVTLNNKSAPSWVSAVATLMYLNDERKASR